MITFDELQEVKRQIICNRGRKESYVRQGMVQEVVSALAKSTDPRLVSTAAQTVGSLCSIKEGIVEFHACEGVPVVLGVLERDPDGLVARQLLWTLKLIAQYDAGSLGSHFASRPVALSSLFGQLKSEVPSAVLNSLHILHACVRESQAFVDGLGLSQVYDESVFTILLESSNKQIALQSINFLQSVMKHCVGKRSPAASYVSSNGSLVKQLRLKVRQPGDVQLHLAACECIVMMFSMDQNAFMSQFEPDILATLIDLISLLEKGCIDAVKPLHLLTLRSGPLATTVIELDVVSKLMKCLRAGHDAYVVHCLLFLRDLAADNERARRQCIDAGVLSVVCEMLNSDDFAFQLAACECLHILSRSIRALKLHVSTTSEALDILLSLAKNSGQEDLLLHSTCILINLCSEPNNLREELMQRGVLEFFIDVYKSEASTIALKSKSLLGISAVAYISTRDIKRKISSLISSDDVKDMLETGADNEELLENGLILIRNMSHNFGPASSPLRDHWDLAYILEKCLEIAKSAYVSTNVLIQALYVAVNSASGRKQEKDAVIDCGWHEMIPVFLRSHNDEVREGAMWLLQNLMAAPRFLPILQELNVDAVLEAMNSDPSLYIRDRSNIVLQELKKASGSFASSYRNLHTTRSRSRQEEDFQFRPVSPGNFFNSNW